MAVETHICQDTGQGRVRLIGLYSVLVNSFLGKKLISTTIENKSRSFSVTLGLRQCRIECNAK